MSAHRTAVRRGRPEHDGVIVMGADLGIPRVLTGLAGITRLCRCARGVPVLSAFAADTGVQVSQPGVGREANALGEKPRNGQMTRFAKRPSMAVRRAAAARPRFWGPLDLWWKNLRMRAARDPPRGMPARRRVA